MSPVAATVRVGELRPSQLQHTFGVGSIVDLPNISAVVMGLDGWDLTGPDIREVSEPRLLAAVRSQVGDSVTALRLPPYLPETDNPFDDWARVGVRVEIFPRYLRCPICRYLGPIESGLFTLKRNAHRPELNRMAHTSCPKAMKGEPTAIPVRFLVACEAGHLDDFPWLYYVHRGETCSSPMLRFGERGVSGDAASIYVRCECGTGRSMAVAFSKQGAAQLPRCRGRHPHLRSFAPDGCDQQVRAIALGASNLWFPAKLAVVSIPQANDPIGDAVEKHWAQLADMESAAEVRGLRKGMPVIAEAFADLDDAAVFAAVERYRTRSAGAADPTDVLTPEWQVFTHPEQARQGSDFRLQPREVPAAYRGVLDGVLAVTRLREVSALYGFTRIVAPNETVDGTGEVAPLSSGSPKWLPCAETRGEGVFLRFRQLPILAWQNTVDNTEEMVRLQAGHAGWCAQRRVDSARRWVGSRYILLHTLAHALIREFALECGYTASGIRERIYARDDMAGILLYTAAPDSEGTLGGLVRLADPDLLGRVLDQALRAAKLCSSDPMCAEHDPQADASCHNAACHACLFAAETSCEAGNRFLDRGLLVPTFATSDTAFFERG